MPAWGASTHMFHVQLQQTSLSERLVYVQLQCSRLPCDDDGFFLAIAIRAIKPMHIKVFITCLCYFFNIVSQKVIGHK
jgi:hypothetical protein